MHGDGVVRTWASAAERRFVAARRAASTVVGPSATGKRAAAIALAMALGTAPALAWAWTPLAVNSDPLVRMPGTQPGQITSFEAPAGCIVCHGSYAPSVEPAFGWRGSMMAQAARDPLFWPAFTVAAQDSIWLFGRPNAADMCERCHFPAGWLGGRSDPTNASMMTGADFDGVDCGSCHRFYDPFFEDTASGVREGSDWAGYWDESNATSSPSQSAADQTRMADSMEASALRLFNGQPLYDATMHIATAGYTDNAGGQYFAAESTSKRGPFADTNPQHLFLYSRYNKSKFFCASCHDVSNAPLANASFAGTPPNDGMTVLPTESQPAHAYFPVERTFSEFMLSDFGLPGGAPGSGPFAPAAFKTSRPGNVIATCQDCHMPDRAGQGCNLFNGVLRPADSLEHPKSGVPSHDLTGGNALVPFLLASTVMGSPNFDQQNADLLGQGPAVLTLDLAAGVPLDPLALLAARNRAIVELGRAASIQGLTYSAATGATAFRIVNQTGHKLISGYPEGRRMFASIRLYQGGNLIHEVNPYNSAMGTLAGLDPAYSPSSPPLGAGQSHDDALVYEVHSTSTYLGGAKTFHFILSTGAFKDNRIPPKGFRIAEASARMAEPQWDGMSAPGLFTAGEYAGGYDDVSVVLPAGGDKVEVALYYQTTSREYIEFLRDEINGTATSLPSPAPSGEPTAYIVQTDPFFTMLRPWGDTVWQLWQHNKDVPGAAPVRMTQAVFALNTCQGMPNGTACDDGNECTTGEVCSGGLCQSGTTAGCDDQNECTDDSCDPALGCQHSFNTAPCESGDLCTGPDACAFGVCVSGPKMMCYDGDPCTDDTCYPNMGCPFMDICGAGGAGGAGSGGGGGKGGAPNGNPPEDDGGCNCTTAGSRRMSEGAFVLAIAAVLFARLRRRGTSMTSMKTIATRTERPPSCRP